MGQKLLGGGPQPFTSLCPPESWPDFTAGGLISHIDPLHRVNGPLSACLTCSRLTKSLRLISRLTEDLLPASLPG